MFFSCIRFIDGYNVSRRVLIPVQNSFPRRSGEAMSKKILLNIPLVFTGIFCSILLGLGSHGLFASKALWQGSPSRNTLIALFCIGLVGFAAIAAVLVKNRQLYHNNGGKPENQIAAIPKKRRVLNYILILTALLGPFFFLSGVYYGFQEANLLSFVFVFVLEPLSIISIIVFWIINTKYFSKAFSWIGLPLLAVLMLADIYFFAPFGFVCYKIFGIYVYDWVIKVLFLVLS